jgi:hypothetical protein
MDYTPAQSAGGSLIMFFLVGLAAYAYIAFSIQTIANKTGTDNAWMAWIPILNIWLLCEIGGKPGWWVILMFIPFINIVMTVLIWMAVSDARQKSPFLGVLMLIPFLNLFVPGYLAFSE